MKYLLIALVFVFLLGSVPVQAAPPVDTIPVIDVSCTVCRVMEAIRVTGSGFDPSMRFGLRYGDDDGNEWSGGLWSYASPTGTVQAILRFTIPGSYYVYAYQIKSEKSKKMFNKTEKVYFTVQ